MNEWNLELIQMYLASPANFAGVDGIVTNLAKEREPGIEIIFEGPSGKWVQVTIWPLEMKFPQKRSTVAYKSVILETFVSL